MQQEYEMWRCFLRYSGYHEMMEIKWYDRAKQIMRHKKIVQDELICILGVKTRGAVGHYLTGRREPSPDQIKALAHKLGVSIDYLLNNEDYIDSEATELKTDKQLCLPILDKSGMEQDNTALNTQEPQNHYTPDREALLLAKMIMQLTPEQKATEKAAIENTLKTNLAIYEAMQKANKTHTHDR